MKARFIFLGLVVFLGIFLLHTNSYAQELAIRGSWKISWDDKKEFSSADFNDTLWKTLTELKWKDTDQKPLIGYCGSVKR